MYFKNILSLKFLVLVTICIIFSGCKKQPTCNEKQIKKMVIESLKKQISTTILKEFENDFGSNEKKSEYIEPFLNQRDSLINDLEIKLFDVKPNAIQEEIRKCDCQGKVSAIEKVDLSNLKNKHSNRFDYEDFDITNKTPKISFTAQYNDENELFVTILDNENLQIYPNNVMLKMMLNIEKKIKNDNKY